jgi:hypothetical protein
VKLIFSAASTSAIGVIEKTKLTGHLEITQPDSRTFRIVEIEITLDPEYTR